MPTKVSNAIFIVDAYFYLICKMGNMVFNFKIVLTQATALQKVV